MNMSAMRAEPMNSQTSLRSARYSESLGSTDGTQSLGPMKGGSKNG